MNDLAIRVELGGHEPHEPFEHANGASERSIFDAVQRAEVVEIDAVASVIQTNDVGALGCAVGRGVAVRGGGGDQPLRNITRFG